MPDDPYEPGWRPRYTGDDSLGDVGSGGRFGVDLYQLYKAGRVLFPQAAREYASLATQLHVMEPVVRRQLTEGGAVEPAHTLLLELRGELQEVLRRSSINVSEAGVALVEIADSYAATDEAAVAALTNEIDGDDEFGRHYRTPPPHVLEPPAAGDPQPARPEGPASRHLAG